MTMSASTITPNTARQRKTYNTKSTKTIHNVASPDEKHHENSHSTQLNRPPATGSTHGRAHSYPSIISHLGQNKILDISSDSTNSQSQVLMLASMLTSLATQIPTSAVKKVAQTLYSYQQDIQKATKTKGLGEKYTMSDIRNTIAEQSSKTRLVGPVSNRAESSLQLQSQTLDSPYQRILEDGEEISSQLANQGTVSQSRPTSTFTRQLFIHSITHLLRALPHSLTADEVSGIASALPSDVLSSLSYRDSTNVTSQCCCESGNHCSSSLAPQHPTVHRLASISTFGTITCLKVLAPHVRTVAAKGLVFFQDHRLAERGTNLVKGMGELGLKMTTGVFSWMDLQTLFLDEDYDYLVQRAEQFTSADGELYVEDQPSSIDADVAANLGQRKRRAATRRKLVKGLGTWMGGLVSSGIGGMVEGFSSGLESSSS